MSQRYQERRARARSDFARLQDDFDGRVPRLPSANQRRSKECGGAATCMMLFHHVQPWVFEEDGGLACQFNN